MYKLNISLNTFKYSIYTSKIIKLKNRFGSGKKEFIYEGVLRRTINLPGPGQYEEIDKSITKDNFSRSYR